MSDFVLVIKISTLEIVLSILLAIPLVILVSLLPCVLFPDDWRAKWIRDRYKKLYKKIRQ